MYISAIGQDSHRFEPDGSTKPLMLGGVCIAGVPGLAGNSDADVILHALCNAISGLSGVSILGSYTDRLCNVEGITDSAHYVVAALATLTAITLLHISITVEARRPHFSQHIPAIRNRIAELVHLRPDQVGMTATTGEGLTAFGRGEGIQTFIIVSAKKDSAT